MGTDVTAAVKSLPDPSSFKVHRVMCTELRKLVDRVLRVLPEIEAARPRCSSGIKSLCLLNRAIEKAKLLLQHCSESSRLYLALTGDAVVSRCQNSAKLLEQSLAQIQNLVPVILALKISQIIDELGSVAFNLDSDEEEAGRIVKKLLQQGTSALDASENSEMKSLLFVASRLQLTSSKAIRIEKQSIKKLLDKIAENDQRKMTIVKYLLHLLKKYGNSILGEHMDHASDHNEASLTFQKCSEYVRYNQCSELEPTLDCGEFEPIGAHLSRPLPPEEFKCPLSSRLMYDPVVIASGQTYERLWIQKWFDEGNHTCPRTRMELPHMSLTPNVFLKDLIFKWCARYGVTIPNPGMQPEALYPWEASISSFGSSMNDLHLQVDLSNMSLGSLDNSYASDSSNTRSTGINQIVMRTHGNSHCHQSHSHLQNMDLVSFSKLSDLQWGSQCQLIEDFKQYLERNVEACQSLTSEEFIGPLINFLSTACSLNDLKAQKAGIQLLLVFVRHSRNDLLNFNNDAFGILASFIDSEAREEALSVMEALSANHQCPAKIAASGALKSIIEVLNSQGGEYKKYAIRTLCNMSLNGEICSHMISLDCIPKLVLLSNDSMLAGGCIRIMKNLCNTEEGRVCIAKTKGCLSFVAQILETGSQQDQEHATMVLLSLCSQHDQYCCLVMAEGVIPSLVNISINGNDTAKVYAQELLRILRDTDYSEEECLGSDHGATQDSKNNSKEKKSSKSSGFFGMRVSLFSRSTFQAGRKR